MGITEKLKEEEEHYRMPPSEERSRTPSSEAHYRTHSSEHNNHYHIIRAVLTTQTDPREWACWHPSWRDGLEKVIRPSPEISAALSCSSLLAVCHPPPASYGLEYTGYGSYFRGPHLHSSREISIHDGVRLFSSDPKLLWGHPCSCK